MSDRAQARYHITRMPMGRRPTSLCGRPIEGLDGWWYADHLKRARKDGRDDVRTRPVCPECDAIAEPNRPTPSE